MHREMPAGAMDVTNAHKMSILNKYKTEQPQLPPPSVVKTAFRFIDINKPRKRFICFCFSYFKNQSARGYLFEIAMSQIRLTWCIILSVT